MHNNDEKWIKKWGLIAGTLIMLAVLLPIIFTNKGITYYNFPASLSTYWNLVDITHIYIVIALGILPFVISIVLGGKFLAIFLFLFGVLTIPVYILIVGIPEGSGDFILILFVTFYSICVIGVGNSLGYRYPEKKTPQALVLIGSIIFLILMAYELFHENDMGIRYYTLLTDKNLWSGSIAVVPATLLFLIVYHLLSLARVFSAALAGLIKFFTTVILIVVPVALAAILVKILIDNDLPVFRITGSVVPAVSLVSIKLLGLIYGLIICISAGLYATIAIWEETRNDDSLLSTNN